MLTPNFGDQWGPKITNNLELGDRAHFKLHTWQDKQTQQQRQPPVLDTLMDLNGVCGPLSHHKRPIALSTLIQQHS